MLAPIAWATPPAAYGPWEQVTSHLTEGLLKKGIDVTLFATASSRSSGRLVPTVDRGYAEQPGQNAKVLEYLHISRVMGAASDFDLIHNQFDFMPLSFSHLIDTPMLTTIHGFSEESIVPVYEWFNEDTDYVSISDANRDERLDYIGTVYNGIDVELFTPRRDSEDYLVYFGRIHPEKGAAEAIDIAKRSGRDLVMAGLIQDEAYFEERIKPHIDGDKVRYLGNVGPAERDRILGGAAALLHPIRFDEPFGLSVAESMMTGTPVIAFNRGSMPELIDHERNGFLVDDVEEAANLVPAACELDRERIATEARDRFSVERMVEGYISVYESMLDR